MATPSPRAKEIFLDAFELEEAEREAFLARACAGDEELERRVRALLSARGRAEVGMPRTFAGALVTPHGPASGTRLGAGMEIGPYRLGELLGEGGFGVVYRAEQLEPIRRTVAIKVLRLGLGSALLQRRFAAEQELLARMDHPGIAKIFDAGTTSEGQPWFAMELVPGEPITQYCRARRLSQAARLALFEDTCRAVQHAHQKGVVHRDLKPSNVLVTESDGRPRPVVIDFGIAKVAREQEAAGDGRASGGQTSGRSWVTRTGSVLGTPAYMSPEQMRGVQDVDTRTDVYALGVLFYELLSDALPFDEDTLRSADLVEIQRLVTEVEPPRPSRRLEQSARAAGTPRTRRALLARARRVRGDLDWIVMRCLEKDRERRYSSVGELALDVARTTTGEPVSAGPPTLVYRWSKFARRHRALLTTAGLVSGLLIGATIVSWRQAVRARRAEELSRAAAEQVRTELAKYEQITAFLQDVLLGIDPKIAQGEDRTLLQRILERASERVATETAGAPEVEATARLTIGRAWTALAYYAEALPHLERALELFRQTAGPDDTSALEALSDLAGTYLQLGRPNDATPLLEESLERHEKIYGRQHLRTLSVLSNLAHVRIDEGSLEEAADILTEVERVRLAKLGPEDGDTLLVKNTMAGLLMQLGRSEEALARYEELARVQRRVLGPKHPQTLSAVNNLAYAYLQFERDAEAVPLLEEAIAIKTEVLDPDHPSVITSLANLASAQRGLERYDDALATFTDALERSRRRLGEDHVSTLTIRLNLASLLSRQGSFEEAALELADVRARFDALVGAEDLRTLSATYSLADALVGGGGPERADEALELARGLVATDEGHFPPGHAGPANNLLLLGRALAGSSRAGESEREEARELILQAHERFRELGDEDGLTRARSALAALFEAWGRPDEARAWRDEL